MSKPEISSDKTVYKTDEGGWGNNIYFTFPEEFEKEMTDDSLYSVVGWKRIMPSVGDLLESEFERSFMTFEFVKVDYKHNPPDMFFAKVKPVKQVMK